MRDADADFDLRELETNYQQMRGQLQNWSRLSLVSATTGLLLGALWAIAAIFGAAQLGVNTAIPSIILELVAGLAFVQQKTAQKQAELIRSEIAERNQFRSIIKAAAKIKDQKLRDESIAAIVRKTPTRKKQPEKQRAA